MRGNRRLTVALLVFVGLLFAAGVYLGLTVSWVVGSAPIGIAIILAVPLFIILFGGNAGLGERPG